MFCATKITLSVLLVIGLSSCATSFEEPFYDRAQRLENGMTESDVWKLLGPATRIKNKKNKTMYVYYPDKNHKGRPYYVRFIDKEVVGWGPARKMSKIKGRRRGK